MASGASVTTEIAMTAKSNPGGHHLLEEFGFGLGFSVLVDAILVRSMLLPVVMHLIGPGQLVPARPGRPRPAPARHRSSRSGGSDTHRSPRADPAGGISTVAEMAGTPQATGAPLNRPMKESIVF